MADVVQKILEHMLPELENMQIKGIFTPEEIKAIIDKRRDFEFLLRKRIADPADFTRYITYELQLEALRRRRKAKLGIKKTLLSDHSGIRQIHFIFDRATRKFGSRDVSWYLQWIDFALRSNSAKTVDRVFGKALSLHPMSEELWLQAIGWQCDRQHNWSAARALHQRALRINKSNKNLWLAAFKMECLYIMRMKGRRVTLGLDPGPTSVHLLSPSAVAAATASLGGETDATPNTTEYDGLDDVYGLEKKEDGAEEAEEAAKALPSGESTSVDARAAFFAGRVPQILFDAAILESTLKADIQFRQQFLEVLQTYRDVFAAAASEEQGSDFKTMLGSIVPPPAFPDVAAHILETIARDFPSDAAGWEILATYPLDDVGRSVEAYWTWHGSSKRQRKGDVRESKDEELFVEDRGDEETKETAEEDGEVEGIVEGRHPPAASSTEIMFHASHITTKEAFFQDLYSGAFEIWCGINSLPSASIKSTDLKRMALPSLDPLQPFDRPLWWTRRSELDGKDAPKSAAVSGKKRRRTESVSISEVELPTNAQYLYPSATVSTDDNSRHIWNLVQATDAEAVAAVDAMLSFDSAPMKITACRVLTRLLRIKLPDSAENSARAFKLLTTLVDTISAAAEAILPSLARVSATSPSEAAWIVANAAAYVNLVQVKVQSLLRLGRVREALACAATVTSSVPFLASSWVLKAHLQFGLQSIFSAVSIDDVVAGTSKNHLSYTAVGAPTIPLAALGGGHDLVNLSTAIGITEATNADEVAVQMLLDGGNTCLVSSYPAEASKLFEAMFAVLESRPHVSRKQLQTALSVVARTRASAMNVDAVQNLRTRFLQLALQAELPEDLQVDACLSALDLTAPLQSFLLVTSHLFSRVRADGKMSEHSEHLLRKVFEQAVTAHGKESAQLWVDYVKFERFAAPLRLSRLSLEAKQRRGACRETAGDIYARAVRVLHGSANVEFVECMSLL